MIVNLDHLIIAVSQLWAQPRQFLALMESQCPVLLGILFSASSPSSPDTLEVSVFFLVVGTPSKRSWSSVSLYLLPFLTLSNALLCQTPALCWRAYNRQMSWSMLGDDGGELSGGSCKPICILLSFLGEWRLKCMCAHLRIRKIVHSSESRKYTTLYLLYFWDRFLICNPRWCWMCYLIQTNRLKVIFPPWHPRCWDYRCGPPHSATSIIIFEQD